MKTLTRHRGPNGDRIAQPNINLNMRQVQQQVFQQAFFLSWKCNDQISLYIQASLFIIQWQQDKLRTSTEGHYQQKDITNFVNCRKKRKLTSDKTYQFQQRTRICLENGHSKKCDLYVLTCVHCMPCTTTKFGSDVHTNVCSTWNAFILRSMRDGSGPL